MIEVMRIYNGKVNGDWKKRDDKLMLDIDGSTFDNFMIRVDGVIYTEFDDNFVDLISEFI